MAYWPAHVFMGRSSRMQSKMACDWSFVCQNPPSDNARNLYRILVE